MAKSTTAVKVTGFAAAFEAANKAAGDLGNALRTAVFPMRMTKAFDGYLDQVREAASEERVDQLAAAKAECAAYRQAMDIPLPNIDPYFAQMDTRFHEALLVYHDPQSAGRALLNELEELRAFKQRCEERQ